MWSGLSGGFNGGLNGRFKRGGRLVWSAWSGVVVVVVELDETAAPLTVMANRAQSAFSPRWSTTPLLPPATSSSLNMELGSIHPSSPSFGLRTHACSGASLISYRLH